MKLDHYSILSAIASDNIPEAVCELEQYFQTKFDRISRVSYYDYPVDHRELRVFTPGVVYTWREGRGFRKDNSLKLPDGTWVAVWKNKHVT